MKSVGIIGAGNMGSAMIRGWARLAEKNVEVVVWDKIEDATRQFEGFPSVRVASGVQELVLNSEFIFVVVKPKDASEVLQQLRPLLRAGQTFVSVMAGITLGWLREALGPRPALLRIMPNLAVEFGVGTIALAAEEGTEEQTIDACQHLLSPLGLVVTMGEDCLDAVTAVAGSGPAFFALAMEALEDGAVAAGLSRAAARALVLRAASRAAVECIRPPVGLCAGHSGAENRVPSAPAMRMAEERKVGEAFEQAVLAAVERGRSMLLHLGDPGGVDSNKPTSFGSQGEGGKDVS